MAAAATRELHKSAVGPWSMVLPTNGIGRQISKLMSVCESDSGSQHDAKELISSRVGCSFDTGRDLIVAGHQAPPGGPISSGMGGCLYGLLP